MPVTLSEDDFEVAKLVVRLARIIGRTMAKWPDEKRQLFWTSFVMGVFELALRHSPEPHLVANELAMTLDAIAIAANAMADASTDEQH